MRENRTYFTIYIGLAAAIAVALVLAAAGGLGFFSTVQPEDPGETAPDFTLVSLSGKTVNLSESLKEKPIVLNFWASWCPPCQQEAPSLSAVSKDLADKVIFIGIVYQDRAPGANSFIEKFELDFENCLDPGGKTAADYGVSGVPETFWIDRDGMIVNRKFGPADTTELVRNTESLIED